MYREQNRECVYWCWGIKGSCLDKYASWLCNSSTITCPITFHATLRLRKMAMNHIRWISTMWIFCHEKKKFLSQTKINTATNDFTTHHKSDENCRNMKFNLIYNKCGTQIHIMQCSNSWKIIIRCTSHTA